MPGQHCEGEDDSYQKQVVSLCQIVEQRFPNTSLKRLRVRERHIRQDPAQRQGSE